MRDDGYEDTMFGELEKYKNSQKEVFYHFGILARMISTRECYQVEDTKENEVKDMKVIDFMMSRGEVLKIQKVNFLSLRDPLVKQLAAHMVRLEANRNIDQKERFIIENNIKIKSEEELKENAQAANVNPNSGATYKRSSSIEMKPQPIRKKERQNSKSRINAFENLEEKIEDKMMLFDIEEEENEYNESPYRSINLHVNTTLSPAQKRKPVQPSNSENLLKLYTANKTDNNKVELKDQVIGKIEPFKVVRRHTVEEARSGNLNSSIASGRAESENIMKENLKSKFNLKNSQTDSTKKKYNQNGIPLHLLDNFLSYIDELSSIDQAHSHKEIMTEKLDDKFAQSTFYPNKLPEQVIVNDDGELPVD